MVFDEAINGKFNYYQDCDKTKSNTLLKKEHLRCVIEIKGGAQQHESGLGKYCKKDPLGEALRHEPDKRRKDQNFRLAVDIEKLGMWASHFGTKNRDYIFLAIDLRNPKGFWSEATRSIYGQYCIKHGVHLIYFSQDSKSFWQHSPDGVIRSHPVLPGD